MSLKCNYVHLDGPISFDESGEANDIDAKPFPLEDGLSLEEYNAKQENGRKNKVLSFCFKSSPWVLTFAVLLIAADFIAQENGHDTALIKDCLSLVTYVVTAALGFMFGSNSK